MFLEITSLDKTYYINPDRIYYIEVDDDPVGFHLFFEGKRGHLYLDESAQHKLSSLLMPTEDGGA